MYGKKSDTSKKYSTCLIVVQRYNCYKERKGDIAMHYTGTIWRPPYEAASLLIEVTAGCTHHKCKFCTLYNDLPFKFRMSPLEDIEADLKEAAGIFKFWNRKKVTRTFLTRVLIPLQ